MNDGNTNTEPRPDKATLRALAVRYSVDPRSIQAVIAGRPVKGMSGQRAAEAAAEWRRSVGLDAAKGR